MKHLGYTNIFSEEFYDLYDLYSRIATLFFPIFVTKTTYPCVGEGAHKGFA
jgi:hypothetical protein